MDSDSIVAITVPLAFFGTIAGIWITGTLANQKNRTDLNETARRAFEVGQPLSPEMFAALQSPVRAPEHDLRTGIILCAAALGFFATALAFPSTNPATIRATAIAEQPPTERTVVAPAASAASGATNAASATTPASSIVTVVQSKSGASVTVGSGDTEDEDASRHAKVDVDFDGDGFMIPGILVGFLGLGHLASWGIRRKKSV